MGFIPAKALFLVFFQFIILWFDFGIQIVRNAKESNGNQYYAIDFIGMTESNGYKTEAHNVTTPDGYILTIFRVSSNSIYTNVSDEKPVIFMQHGLGGSSDLFVALGRERSIVYPFVDAGYDVWLGNFRGNSYSRAHEKISLEDPEFWNFSNDELSNLDLPSSIDYVLETTNQEKLTYIGHSLGTTTILMLLSAQPEYNDKIQTTILLAPVAFWTTENHARSFLFKLSRWLKKFWPTGLVDVAPQSGVLPFFFDNFCLINSVTLDICYIPYNLLLGTDREQFKAEESKHLLCHYPAGLSAKAFYHYAQHMKNGKFDRYDYEDEQLNIQEYGQKTPPEYNISNIVTPLVIIHSPNDPLSTEDDLKLLTSKLPADTPIIYETIDNEKFNHVDVIFGKDAKTLVYNKLLKILSKIHKSSQIKNKRLK